MELPEYLSLLGFKIKVGFSRSWGEQYKVETTPKIVEEQLKEEPNKKMEALE